MKKDNGNNLEAEKNGYHIVFQYYNEHIKEKMFIFLFACLLLVPPVLFLNFFDISEKYNVIVAFAWWFLLFILYKVFHDEFHKEKVNDQKYHRKGQLSKILNEEDNVSGIIHKNSSLVTELLENAITTPITFEDVASIDDEEIQLLGLGLKIIKESNPNVDPKNINLSLKVISDCGIELPDIKK